MRLDRLLGDVDVLEVRGEAASVEVSAIAHDTAAVRPDTLFCCLKGARADGHDFAPQAVDAGAVALLCERELEVAAAQAIVDATRMAMGPAAAAFHGHPSDVIDVVGVTGTNGKTTTTHLLRSIFEAADRPARTIGTLTGARTTPEATDLQALLASFRDDGVQAVAMEVSSHALDQHRVDGTRFRVAVFTNLTQDHLDYHGSMESYFEAKARLFTPELADAAVVDADDPYGRRLIEQATIPVHPYSITDAEVLDMGVTSSRFVWEGVAIRVPLGGRFNLSNALAAATAARVLGVEPADVAVGIAAAGPVSGRFQPVEAGQPFAVVVDYAHTPDGLEHVLRSARELAGSGRVVVVFGAGGDRDHGKRPLMGEVASRLADRVVLTSDNPRGEEPGSIIDAVMQGIQDPSSVTIEPDRRAAIALAFDIALPGDVVVLAGKGHETVQIFADGEVPFDDRGVAAELLEARWSAS